jgi:hypothetical protein
MNTNTKIHIGYLGEYVSKSIMLEPMVLIRERMGRELSAGERMGRELSGGEGTQ